MNEGQSAAEAAKKAEGSLGPDPLATANIYCTGRLDQVIAGVVLPAWREYRELPAPAGEPAFLWVMRYARCGDHLKLRWHGRAAEAEGWRALLARHFAAFRDALPPEPEGGAPADKKKRPLTTTPIDLEDEAATLHPDRSLLETTYRRSHISLGYYPYLADDGYVGKLVRCLASSTEVLLDACAARPDQELSFAARQNVFLKALATAVAALPFSEAERSSFLHYQRDVVVRDYRKKKNLDRETVELVIGKLDAQVKASAAAGRQLAGQALALWRGGAAPGWSAPYEGWAAALRELYDYADPICRDLAHHIDPFALSPIFPALFKAVHGFANQLGLRPLDEAFAYHFLAHFLAEDLEGPGSTARPVQLRPIL